MTQTRIEPPVEAMVVNPTTVNPTTVNLTAVEATAVDPTAVEAMAAKELAAAATAVGAAATAPAIRPPALRGPSGAERAAVRPPRGRRFDATARPRRYWIVVAAQDAAVAGAAQGYLQLGSGKAGPLERMRGGDGFVVYSPRTNAQGDALQAFTAIGRVRDAPIEMAGLEPGGPFRRAAEFLPAAIAPIRPLLPALAFIRNKAQWGAAFRFGVALVPEEDFARIAQAMGRACAADFPGERPHVAAPP